jgi:hypothetical protein
MRGKDISMSEITINEALVLQKAVRERANELRALRASVSNKESYLYGREEKKVVEPQYDVKAVDRKVVELEKFLMKTDAAIKGSNALTKISVDFDADKLLDPIQ